MTEHATEVEVEEEIVEESEIVELPPNVQRLQEKQARLQQEVALYQAQINEIADKLETAQLAFQQCVVLLQVEEAQSEQA